MDRPHQPDGRGDEPASISHSMVWADVEWPQQAGKVIEHVRLIEATDCRYPVILGADGRVMDGMHRIAKALLAGRNTIQAVQFKIDPQPDYTDCSPADLPYD